MTFSVICLPVSGDDLLNKENFDVALIFAFAIILSHQGRKSVEPFTLTSENWAMSTNLRGENGVGFSCLTSFSPNILSRDGGFVTSLEAQICGSFAPLFEANGETVHTNERSKRRRFQFKNVPLKKSL